MTFEPTITLGTLVQLLSMLGAIFGAYAALRTQIAEMRSQLTDIKERLGCTEETVGGQVEKQQSVMERIIALENDIKWIKAKHGVE